MVYFKTPDNDPVISLHFADPRFLFLGDVNGEIHIIDIRNIQFTEKEIFVDFKPPPPPVPGEENGGHEEIATGNGEYPAAISSAGAGDLQAVNEQSPLETVPLAAGDSPAAGGSGGLHSVSEQPLAGRSMQQEVSEQPLAKTVNLQAGSQHKQSPEMNADLQTNSGLPVVVQPLTERTAALQADCHEPPVAETANLQADCHEPPVAQTASLQADCHEPPVADTAGLQADCHEPSVADTAGLQAGCRLVRTLRSHAYSAFIWSIQSDGMRKEKIRFLFSIAWYKRGKCS